MYLCYCHLGLWGLSWYWNTRSLRPLVIPRRADLQLKYHQAFDEQIKIRSEIRLINHPSNKTTSKEYFSCSIGDIRQWLEGWSHSPAVEETWEVGPTNVHRSEWIWLRKAVGPTGLEKLWHLWALALEKMPGINSTSKSPQPGTNALKFHLCNLGFRLEPRRIWTWVEQSRWRNCIQRLIWWVLRMQKKVG